MPIVLLDGSPRLPGMRGIAPNMRHQPASCQVCSGSGTLRPYSVPTRSGAGSRAAVDLLLVLVASGCPTSRSSAGGPPRCPVSTSGAISSPVAHRADSRSPLKIRVFRREPNPRPAGNAQATVTLIVCRPVAPSGEGLCTCPSAPGRCCRWRVLAADARRASPATASSTAATCPPTARPRAVPAATGRHPRGPLPRTPHDVAPTPPRPPSPDPVSDACPQPVCRSATVSSPEPAAYPPYPISAEVRETTQFQLRQPLRRRYVSVSPGTTIRTGNPCSTGSGSPFIPTASNASRPSRNAAVGVPAV